MKTMKEILIEAKQIKLPKIILVGAKKTGLDVKRITMDGYYPKNEADAENVLKFFDYLESKNFKMVKESYEKEETC